MEVFDAGSSSDYQCCTLTEEGNYAAFASSDGLKVKVFEIESGSLIKEVLRGRSVTEITSLSLVNDKKNPVQWFLSVAGIKETIHQFIVKIGEGETQF